MENEVQKAEFFKVQKIPAEVEKSSGKKYWKIQKNISILPNRETNIAKKNSPQRERFVRCDIFSFWKKNVCKLALLKNPQQKNIYNVKWCCENRKIILGKQQGQGQNQPNKLKKAEENELNQTFQF